MIKIKNILNDLIDYTYPNNENKEKYKKFYVEILDKNLKGRHGDYHPRTHAIRIFNLYRDDAAIMATTIHELTHHVEQIDLGSTGHQKTFYERFQVLLYKALDMKLFSKEEFLSATKDASDSNKIAKMITDYVPKDADYKKDVKRIEVRNCFDKKDLLKQRGYKWNGINKVWEKEFSETQTEIVFLEAEALDYAIYEATDIAFRKQSCIIAKKGSYDYRYNLQADGFTFDAKKRAWKKEGDRDDLYAFQRKYPYVEFGLL